MVLFLSGILWAGVPKKLPPSKERGENLYRDLCWQCHGSRALGDGPLAKQLLTKPPALAGVIGKKEYKKHVNIIQRGVGAMPAYEQLIDRHDSKRILMFLSSLDPKTGLGPPKKKKDKKKKKKKKKEKKKEKKEKKEKSIESLPKKKQEKTPQESP